MSYETQFFLVNRIANQEQPMSEKDFQIFAAESIGKTSFSFRMNDTGTGVYSYDEYLQQELERKKQYESQHEGCTLTVQQCVISNDTAKEVVAGLIKKYPEFTGFIGGAYQDVVDELKKETYETF